MSEASIIETQEIKSKIYTIRGVRVMLDRDLAEFYNGSSTNPARLIRYK